jgi:hypothetical protein
MALTSCMPYTACPHGRRCSEASPLVNARSRVPARYRCCPLMSPGSCPKHAPGTSGYESFQYRSGRNGSRRCKRNIPYPTNHADNAATARILPTTQAARAGALLPPAPKEPPCPPATGSAPYSFPCSPPPSCSPPSCPPSPRPGGQRRRHLPAGNLPRRHPLPVLRRLLPGRHRRPLRTGAALPDPIGPGGRPGARAGRQRPAGPPADTLVLDTTLSVPYTPSRSTSTPTTPRPCFPSTRRTGQSQGPTRNPKGSKTSTTTVTTPWPGARSSSRDHTPSP